LGVILRSSERDEEQNSVYVSIALFLVPWRRIWSVECRILKATKAPKKGPAAKAFFFWLFSHRIPDAHQMDDLPDILEFLGRPAPNKQPTREHDTIRYIKFSVGSANQSTLPKKFAFDSLFLSFHHGDQH
jgi:hypothetical protein